MDKRILSVIDSLKVVDEAEEADRTAEMTKLSITGRNEREGFLSGLAESSDTDELIELNPGKETVPDVAPGSGVNPGEKISDIIDRLTKKQLERERKRRLHEFAETKHHQSLRTKRKKKNSIAKKSRRANRR